MRRILITGANGLLANNLLRKLSKSDEIYATLHTPPIEKISNVNYIQCDFGQSWDIESLPKNIDVVIHAAQSSKYKDFPSQALDVFNVNTLSTAKLLDYSLKAKAKHFIYFSTGGLYSPGQSAVHEQSPMLPVDALNYHFASKFSGELLTSTYSKLIKTTIIRPFFIYGKNQRRSMLIPRLVDNIKKGDIINLDGQDGIKINPIHVDDASSFLLKVIEQETTGLFNMAGPDILSIKEICHIIAGKLKVNVQFRTNTTSPLDLISSTTKMDAILDTHSVKRRFIEGISDVL